MLIQARLVGGTQAELTSADGSTRRSGAPDIDQWLSHYAGHPVQLARHQASGGMALHLLSTASLRALAAALPRARIDVTRFRPSIVVDVEGAGHPEHSWTGQRLQAGTATLRVTSPCRRCVMISQATPSVPADPSILRWVSRELRSMLGIYAVVERPGTVHPGDRVTVIR
jgi:uncharacterized protein YcbX